MSGKSKSIYIKGKNLKTANHSMDWLKSPEVLLTPKGIEFKQLTAWPVITLKLFNPQVDSLWLKAAHFNIHEGAMCKIVE